MMYMHAHSAHSTRGSNSVPSRTQARMHQANKSATTKSLINFMSERFKGYIQNRWGYSGSKISGGASYRDIHTYINLIIIFCF